MPLQNSGAEAPRSKAGKDADPKGQLYPSHSPRGEEGAQAGAESAFGVGTRLARTMSVQNKSDGGGEFGFEQVRRQLRDGNRVPEPAGTTKHVFGGIDEAVEA